MALFRGYECSNGRDDHPTPGATSATLPVLAVLDLFKKTVQIVLPVLRMPHKRDDSYTARVQTTCVLSCGRKA